MTTAPVESPEGVGPARERILGAAYELFSQRGIQAVGIDAIVERSGVARQTLYRQFGSKQELVLAFLARRESRWTRGWLQLQVERRTSNPAARLMAIFDVFDEWFHTPDFEGCSFINVMLEHADGDDPIRQASTSYLTGIREFLQELAHRGGHRGSRRLRAQVAHPHEGLDRRRRRGRRGGWQARAAGRGTPPARVHRVAVVSAPVRGRTVSLVAVEGLAPMQR